VSAPVMQVDRFCYASLGFRVIQIRAAGVLACIESDEREGCPVIRAAAGT